MTLKDIPFKVAYSSSRGDDLLNDFYIPSLSSAHIYRRVAGYFSSNSLAVAAKGIAHFITINDGFMQLVCNVYLSESDKSVIEQHLNKLSEDFIIDLENMEDELKKDHLKCLGWMLSNKKLDIKFAVITNLDGIQHEKIGILEDKEGNMVSFTGSDNETWKGWLVNNEKFHVFCNWNGGEEKHLMSDIVDFNSYWDNDVHRALVYDLENAIINGIIRIAPRNNAEFKRLSKKVIDELLKKNKELARSRFKEWPHKKIAVNALMENKQGVIEMATGTGKTSVAINILNTLIAEKKVNGSIISTYGNDLLDQWYLELVDRSNEDLLIYRYYGEHKELSDFIINHDNSILLLNWSNLINIINHDDIVHNKLLIVDEVHGFGSKSLRENLKDEIKKIEYRVGLSATSEREYDDIGNKFIEDELGPIIYKYELNDAIIDGVLCEFKYIPLHYELSGEDKEDLRKAFNIYYAKLKQGNTEYDSRIQLYMDLARVRKLSKNKLPLFEEYLKVNPDILNKTIIFVETKEYGKFVQEILIDINPSFHTYYAEDNKENLLKFARGELDLLVTCKKISQGIDIRSIRNIILFSASRGQLETIQRIGRCLRIDPYNLYKKASVLDFIVKTKEEIDDDYDDSDELREKWLLQLSKIKRKLIK